MPATRARNTVDTGRNESQQKFHNMTWKQYLEQESKEVMRRYEEAMSVVETRVSNYDTTHTDFDRTFEKAQDDLEETDFHYDTDESENSAHDSVLEDLLKATTTLNTLYQHANANIETEKAPVIEVDWDDERKKAKKVLGIGQYMAAEEGAGVKRTNSKRTSGIERALTSMTKGVKKLVKGAVNKDQ